MRSDNIRVSSSGEGFDNALAEVEAVAKYKGLSEKQALHLRLLAEEMMGMLRGLIGETDAVFYIDDDKKDFRLHLSADTVMDSEKRRKLLETSTSGRNERAKGVVGKLRDLFEQALEPVSGDVPSYYSTGWIVADTDPMGVDLSLFDNAWSLNRYRDAVKNDAEKWDELEKSIVANLADEIRIGIRGSSVEMIIYKKM